MILFLRSRPRTIAKRTRKFTDACGPRREPEGRTGLLHVRPCELWCIKPRLWHSTLLPYASPKNVCLQNDLWQSHGALRTKSYVFRSDEDLSWLPKEDIW
jgi:hypothetical protein